MVGKATLHDIRFNISLYFLNIKIRKQAKIPLLSVRDLGLLVIVINFTTKKRRRSMNGTTQDQT